MGTRTVLYERRGTIIPLITLMKGASGTPDPPCVSDRPRMSECPNVRINPSVCASSPTRKTDPARHPSTPHSSTAIRDAGRRRERRRRRRTPTSAKRTTVCDANTTRRRDDANPDARRRGRARARANADWTPRRRGARRSERAMGLETALLRNHERLGKIALTGGFAFGFAYTTKTGTSPLAGWGWTPRTREASARAATAND